MTQREIRLQVARAWVRTIWAPLMNSSHQWGDQPDTTISKMELGGNPKTISSIGTHIEQWLFVFCIIYIYISICNNRVRTKSAVPMDNVVRLTDLFKIKQKSVLSSFRFPKGPAQRCLKVSITHYLQIIEMGVSWNSQQVCNSIVSIAGMSLSPLEKKCAGSKLGNNPETYFCSFVCKLITSEQPP